MFGLFKKDHLNLTYIPQGTINRIVEAQAEGSNSVRYHGGCTGCIFLAGNALREGIVFCTGCQYFKADWRKPDLGRRASGSMTL